MENKQRTTSRSSTGTGPKRHSTFWFQDGSVILHVEDTLFRVHRSVLEAHSKSFLEEFKHSHDLKIDGCLVITLQERPSDIFNLLKVLYDSFWFGHHFRSDDAAITFLCIVLRMSTKYSFLKVREKAIEALKQTVPTTYSDLVRILEDKTIHITYQNAAKIINAAREADVPQLLPYVFYRYSQLEPQQIIQSDLTWKDKAICLAGRDTVLHAQKAHTWRCLLQFQPSVHCRRNPKCKSISQTPRVDWEIRLSREVIALRTLNWATRSACDMCVAQAQDIQAEGIRSVWDLLPQMFNLGTWDEISNGCGEVTRKPLE